MHSEGSISIWFFIGISLFGNGLLILAAGLYELAHPPLNPTIVLFSMHANVWWGALLLIAGAIYCYFFRPGRVT
jgi:hypothetical protein